MKETIKEQAEYLGSPSAETMSDSERLVALILLAQKVPEALLTAEKRVLEEVDNSRDHDSCECDNCNRWRKFYKNKMKTTP